MSIFIGIDPGPIKSAYVIWDGEKLYGSDILDNYDLMYHIRENVGPNITFNSMGIEMVSSYGMPVGKDVFETVFWIGRFCHEWGEDARRVYRKDIKMHLCNSSKAKDSNVITALVDRFDPNRFFGKYSKGTKKEPGLFYGFSRDIWQAFAVAVYCVDIESE